VEQHGSNREVSIAIYPFENLTGRINKIGAEEKYHHTITIAAIKMVRHFLDKSTYTGFREFLESNRQLRHRFRELLASYFSIDIFTSTQAREKFIVPDLIPFD
jgi:hypothetical protein